MLKEVQTKDEALTKIQLKIMDIAPPLIELAARVRSFSIGQTEEPSPMEARIRRTIKASLQQWSQAYANITKLRREAYVKKVEPHLEFLLEEKIAFAEGNEAQERLFTDVFLSRKLKEAQNDVTLNAADKAIAASDPASLGRGRRKPNFRPARHGQAAGQPFESRRSEGFRDFGFQGKKNGFQRPKNNFSNDRRYMPRFSFSNSPSLPVISPPPSTGGRLRLFASLLASITDDPWVLDTISNGLDNDFISVLVQTVRPRDIGMSAKMADVCNAEIVFYRKKRL
jgi:hypothetical protein